jgi:hypothetical protein
MLRVIRLGVVYMFEDAAAAALPPGLNYEALASALGTS